MPSNQIAPKHLTQIEVARRWRLSERTLEKWRSIRRGPAYLKIGGRVVYRPEDIEAFERQQVRVPGRVDDGEGEK